MKFILGTKQNMSQFWGENGKVIPVTILSAGPVTVTKVKTSEKDGYASVQVGYGFQKKERVSKPALGNMNGGSFKHLKEFRVKKDSPVEMNVGDVIDVSSFNAGDVVTVSATSKGKGFQGVVKRHGFHGDKRSHGRKHSERKPGSIGGGLRNRVPKGMRMAGRMGSDRVTFKNLKIVAVDKDQSVVLVSGAIPGGRGTLVEIVG